MDISDCTQIHIDMELYYKFTIKLIQSKLNPCDVGYGESFLKPGNGNMGKPEIITMPSILHAAI